MPEHFTDLGQPPGGVTVTLLAEGGEDLAEQPPQFGALAHQQRRRELVDRAALRVGEVVAGLLGAGRRSPVTVRDDRGASMTTSSPTTAAM
jgi:hypothetical protein